MLDLPKYSPSTNGTPSQRPGGISLTRWVHQIAGIRQAQVRIRLRGNNLHILFESQPCPSSATIVPQLSATLTAEALEHLLPPDAPQIYRVIVYGRSTNQTNPEWTESFYLNQSTQSISPAPEKPQATLNPIQSAPNPTQSAPAQLATLSIAQIVHLACQGQPEAIARYLSHSFGNTETAIRARVEAVESSSRLIIHCESAYCPDPLLLADPIAHQLRELELENFLDAVVLGQVSGEARPEWALRIDLTPPDEILRDWAHWGDVQAITRLLNRVLEPHQIETSALLKESTLHLDCRSTQSAVPDKLSAIAAIAALLESLAPQGICAAPIYGLQPQLGTATPPSESPAWVHWLELPAASQLAGAHTTLELAQQGNLDAIAFLLARLLNPSLDAKLATGGIRVQLRQKGDLLHIMTDAPTCPQQSQVGTAVARFLQPLQIPSISGVRVYGRRAGQKRPLWSYGLDFARREHRLVPEATPEFAVSDAYVSDLLSPPGALVLRTDLPQSDWRSILGRFLEGTIERVQRSLIRSQLFVPSESESINAMAINTDASTNLNQQGSKIALVWGTIGLLLVIQSDWLVGQWLQPTPISTPLPTVSPTNSETPVAPLPNLSLKKSHPGGTAFNSTGFTQPGTETLTSAVPEKSIDATIPSASANLAASLLQPKAAIFTQDAKAYPTFNSRQLNDKVALYKQHLAEHGPPDILVIGSSRALRGVDPVALKKALAEQGYTGTTVFNFGVNGATAQVVDLVIRQILPQDKLPKLILWADGARAFNSGRADVTYNGIVASEGYKTLLAGVPPIAGTTIAQVPVAKPTADPAKPTSVSEESPSSVSGGYQSMNQTLDERLGALSLAYSQRDQLKTRVRETLFALLPKRLTDGFNGAIAFQSLSKDASNLSNATSPAAAANSPAVLSEGQGMVDIDGFLPLSNRFNPATYYQKYARVPGDYDSDYESFALEGKQTEALTSLVQFTQTHQVPLVFVNLPLTNDYLDPPRKQHEEEFQQHMLRLSTQLGFVYRDLNQILAAQPDYFSDPSHLNRYGAYAVSQRLAKDVMVPWQVAK